MGLNTTQEAAAKGNRGGLTYLPRREATVEDVERGDHAVPGPVTANGEDGADAPPAAHVGGAVACLLRGRVAIVADKAADGPETCGRLEVVCHPVR